MIFRRFALRLLRLGLYLGILWVILAALWFGLPSPLPSETYPTTTLNNGKSLTRLFKIDDFYLYNDKSKAVEDARQSRRWYMAVDFSLYHDQETKYLEVGGGNDPLSGIFGLNTKTFTPYNVSLDIGNSTDKIAVVSKSIQLTAKTGDTDGVNPPWLAVADAALLFWWIHHDSATISIRTRAIAVENKLEIWPDATFWHTSIPDSAESWNLTLDKIPKGISPLLTIQLSDNQPPSFQFPGLPKSSSPSPLYPVRLCIFAVLAPISILFLAAFYGTVSIVGTVLSILIQIMTLFATVAAFGAACVVLYGFFWWYRNGRPPVPIAELGQAVSNVIATARNRSAEPAVEETGLIDLEAGPRQQETETEMLVDVSTPEVPSMPIPATESTPSST